MANIYQGKYHTDDESKVFKAPYANTLFVTLCVRNIQRTFVTFFVSATLVVAIRDAGPVWLLLSLA